MIVRKLAAVALVVAAVLGATGCLDRSSEHRVRANAFLRGGDAESALKECDAGLGLKPDDPALLILRGKALFELDRMEEARGAYERAIAMTPESRAREVADAHLGIGMIGARTNDWQTARKHFEVLVGFDGRIAPARLNLARACLALKDLPCAIEHAEAAGHNAGNDEPVLFMLGTVYLAADRPQDAELTFNHICEVVPQTSSCPYGLALVAAKTGDKPKALAKLKEAIDKKIPNPEKLPNEAYFAPLKDDPEFQALVAKAQAQ